MSEVEWKVQKLCTDIGDYELIVEQQKRDWQCDQSSQSWKWVVVFHGSIVASGSVNDAEEAKRYAEQNVPKNVEQSANDCASCAEGE
ncbi:MAG: hypothetical protein GW778_07460 [Alphaproteobacteria bacterium]|nr:hypothetical protein [Alphaproteobacteria bacterium]